MPNARGSRQRSRLSFDAANQKRTEHIITIYFTFNCCNLNLNSVNYFHRLSINRMQPESQCKHWEFISREAVECLLWSFGVQRHWMLKSARILMVASIKSTADSDQQSSQSEHKSWGEKFDSILKKQILSSSQEKSKIYSNSIQVGLILEQTWKNWCKWISNELDYFNHLLN